MNNTVTKTSTGLLVEAGTMTSVTIDAVDRSVLEVGNRFISHSAAGIFTIGLGFDLIKCQAVQAKIPLARRELRRVTKRVKTAYDDYVWECSTYHEKDSLYQTLIVSTPRKSVCKIIKMLTIHGCYREPFLLRCLEPGISALIRLLPRIPDDQALVLLDQVDSGTLLFYIFRDHVWTFITSLRERNRFDAPILGLATVWVVDPVLVDHSLLAAYPVQRHPVLASIEMGCEDGGGGASKLSRMMAYALACSPLV